MNTELYYTRQTNPLPEAAAPFYDLVPKDQDENVRFRLWLRNQACDDPDLQADLREMCALDCLFFVNLFMWLYEPRGTYKVLPFITWPHQDWSIRCVERMLELPPEEQTDISVEKSREQGMSWFVLGVILKHWLYSVGFSAGLISKDEKAVDNPNNPDSLMWKLDWNIALLPAWMTPNFSRNKDSHSLSNHDVDSTINGYAATGDAASGGRKTLFFMDELAKFPRGADYEVMNSTQFVTKIRILGSTPKGDQGAYYDALHDEKRDIVKLVLHWSMNPQHNRGMYQYVDGALHKDPDYDYPANYQFIKDGKLRSPYYDKECRRTPNPKSIAQELDLSYEGSVDVYFEPERLAQLIKTMARPPLRRFHVNVDPETLKLKLVQSDAGELLVWGNIDIHGDLKPGQYTTGVDLCHGTGGSDSSNTVLEMIDNLTREQVLEFVSNRIAPPKMALIAAAISRWAYNALLTWDDCGPTGTLFRNAIRPRYRRLYYRNVDPVGTLKEKTQKPGHWVQTDDHKALIFTNVILAAESRELIIYSKDCIREYGEFSFDTGGKIVHRGAKRSDDESDVEGKAHGDRAYAMAICYDAVTDRPRPKERIADLEANPPQGTLAHRLREHRHQQEQELGMFKW